MAFQQIIISQITHQARGLREEPAFQSFLMHNSSFLMHNSSVFDTQIIVIDTKFIVVAPAKQYRFSQSKNLHFHFLSSESSFSIE